MKIKLIIIQVICLHMISIGSFSQLLYTENDSIQLDQETVVLRIDNYRGHIQWQFSDENMNWNDLGTEESQELELPVKGSAGYYRASIIEGNCTPVYSETAKIVYETPSVLTKTSSGLTFNSVSLNGDVTDNGGTDVTSRGFYWSSSNAEPNDQDNVENIEGGNGEFTVSLSELEANTTYYVRAYATNSEGTSVGEVISFSTPAIVDIPVIVTNAATVISSSSVTLNGNITSDGGAAVTSRGFYWSKTNNNPGSGDNVETSGNGTGVFSASLIGLEANTTYYVRAFAVNGEGTSVGEVVSFTTNASGDLPKSPGWNTP